MVPFDFLVPYSLAEALSLLDPEDPDIRPVGGGTAIMLMMKAGVLRPTRLVSLRHIEERYSTVGVNDQGELVIGGLARIRAIECNPMVLHGWPLLARTMHTLSNVRVRCVATIGGSLGHADPHMDLPPVLSALNARATVTCSSGSRAVPIVELCTGYYETSLARDELITEIIVPPQAGPGAYLKVTTRAAHDWPALGVAVVLSSTGTQPGGASLVVGAATDRPTRLSKAQHLLSSAGWDEQLLRQAGEAAAAEITFVSDSHGSDAYKRHLLKVVLPRALRVALQQGSVR